MNAQPATSATAAPAPSTSAPVYERPPPGLARGRYPAPAWLVAALGGALFVAVVAFLVLRGRRARRKRSESLAPPSSRR
jgi:hypothetical protein